MNDSNWDYARLIPISGIGGAEEQELRSTSALLAVVSAVDEFGKALLKPLGAPAGKVEAFCEVPFKLDPKKKDSQIVRPDGLIRITRGKTHWEILVEVKTGANELKKEQVENYLQIARDNKFQGGLLTISNQIVPVEGHHPIQVNKQRFGRVPLQHLSWSKILKEAILVKEHKGVKDEDQAWILQELIRYLHYDKSGVLSFNNLGSNWTMVRSAIRKKDPVDINKIRDVAFRWDQFIQHLCLGLSVDLGLDVIPLMSYKERADLELRKANVANILKDEGDLVGGVQIPNAAGNIEITANVESSRTMAEIDLKAADMKTGQGRLNWLLRQLRNIPDKPNEDHPICAENVDILASYLYKPKFHASSLAKIREDPTNLLQDSSLVPTNFTVKLNRKIGMTMKKGPGGFVYDAEHLVYDFYREIVQDIKKWTPRAPKLPKEIDSDEGEE